MTGDIITDGELEYDYGEEIRVLTFPDSGNARHHFKKILRGRDYRLLRTKHYEPEFFIDIGANVGATSIYFSQHFPKTRFLCYEPSPTTFGYLKANTARIHNLECFNFGLNDKDETLKLYTGRAQCLQNSLHADAEVGDAWQAVEIRCALNELRKQVTKSSILKIDTEGCELGILRNIQPILPLFDAIYLEFHSEDDRIAIDTMLRENYALWLADVNWVHRGLLGYVSKDLAEKEPRLKAVEISGEKMEK